ncbi:hypothetical protein FQR65_LT05461 [Abscondita terminalis]|nr:hypothetical protein FQR65_LT05461 [Abscondita terminalis]
MVKERPVDSSINTNGTLCYDYKNGTDVAPIDYGGTLDWSLNAQFYVLSSFYWTYILSVSFGGTFTQRYGTKKVFGWAIFISSICIICTPYGSYINYRLVVALQAILGFAQGLTWPALYAVIGIWIPINERSRFVTCFQGLSLGITTANLISGFIITTFGWNYVFYYSGSYGLISTIAWYLLMHNKPEHHPRISNQELKYIQENREQCLHSENKIPWISILKSIPVWAIGIASFGRMWSATFMTIYGPLYLKKIVNLPVEMNGLLNAASSIIYFLSAILYSFIADKLVIYKILSLVHNRKLFGVMGLVVSGIVAITMGYINCNVPLVVGIWLIHNSFFAANFQGTMTNIVDIAPSYTGPVSCVIQIILLLGSLLCPVVLKTFLTNEKVLQSWQTIFYINSGVAFGASIFYLTFASGKVQTWDLAKNSKNLRQRNTEYLLLKRKQTQM